jgi:chaperonin GroEL
MTLYRIADKLGDTVGEKIMRRALKMPLRKIIENGGKDYTEVVLGMGEKGYDAKNGIYVDLHKAGIIDPVKVERCAVENATSLASTFLTVHGSVALVRELPVKGE